MNHCFSCQHSEACSWLALRNVWCFKRKRHCWGIITGWLFWCHTLLLLAELNWTVNWCIKEAMKPAYWRRCAQTPFWSILLFFFSVSQYSRIRNARRIVSKSCHTCREVCAWLVMVSFLFILALSRWCYKVLHGMEMPGYWVDWVSKTKICSPTNMKLWMKSTYKSFEQLFCCSVLGNSSA